MPIAKMKPGDWICQGCNNHNFASRQECNKCQGPRTDEGAEVAFAPMVEKRAACGASPYARPSASPVMPNQAVRKQPEMKEGDWLCPECSNHNFASRVHCNKCNALREGMKDGDWVCRGCKHHNFARNTACKKCQQPRMLAEKGAGVGMDVFSQFTMQMMQQAYLAGQAGISFPLGGCGGCGGFPGCAGGGGCCGAVAPQAVKGMKQGDWMCPACNNHNFASRTACNRCSGQRPGYKPGDWTCQSCKAHNFASREFCLKCDAPKPASPP